MGGIRIAFRKRSAITSLKRLYPKYKNIVPRDIATREIFYICEQGYGIGNGQMVYLDLTEKSTGIKYEVLKKRLGGILEIYEKFVGVDPLLEPMRIYPAIHYSMGGLWVGYERDSAAYLTEGGTRGRNEIWEPCQSDDEYPRALCGG